MNEIEIFFVLGNSRDPYGQEDFVNGLRNICDQSIYDSYGLDWPFCMDVRVKLTQEIVPGEINIFVENFACDFVDHLIDVKRSRPDTHYVVILTEFPTVSNFGYLTFNSFTRAEEIWSMVIRLKNLRGICSTDNKEVFALLTHGLSNDSGNKWESRWKFLCMGLFSVPVRLILTYTFSFRRILLYVRRCLGDVSRPNDRLSYEKRLASLLRVRDQVSLYLVTHPELKNMYGRLSFGPINEFPLLFSPTPIQQQARRPNGIFFSGNLTKFREKRLKELRTLLFKPYRQYQYLEEVLALLFSCLTFQNVDRKKLKSILTDGLPVYIAPEKINDLIYELEKNDKSGISNSNNMKRINEIVSIFSEHYPPIISIEGAYANKYSISALPRYEIYLPQASNWRWSSPVRAFRSLFHGMRPVNFGEFADHEIVSIASQVKDHEGLKRILIEDADDNEMLIRIRRYHEEIYPKVETVVRSFIDLGEGKSAG